jgi:hypothetical protein
MRQFILYPRCAITNSISVVIALSILVGCGQPAIKPGEDASPVKPLPRAERLSRAQQLLATGKTYPLGSADFVCDVLGINYHAEQVFLDHNASQVTSMSTLVPGDIVGWKGSPPACDPVAFWHVAIYTGVPTRQFITVAIPGRSPDFFTDLSQSVLYKCAYPLK